MRWLLKQAGSNGYITAGPPKLFSSPGRWIALQALVSRPARRPRHEFQVPKYPFCQTHIATRAMCRSFVTSSSTSHGSTIYALSTPPGHSAIAVIRCSGPRCLDIYQAFCPDKPIPKPRVATLRKLYRPQASVDALSEQTLTNNLLDPGALVLYFPAPQTFTGEDVLEFHVHGGLAVVRAVLASIPQTRISMAARSGTIRYAEPGEFTQRAFGNARLSLLQVEALASTLAADTAQQHRAAMTATTGATPLATLYAEWEHHLVGARGELEALIDFAEDQSFDEDPGDFVSSVSTQVVALRTRLAAHIEQAARGELLRNGIDVALLGAPNAGKSSLLNAIVGRAAAIVSPEPGTTRDILDVRVDIEGYACRFGDLAGLRGSDNGADIDSSVPVASETPMPLGAVEREGIRRAKARALAAQIVIVLHPVESGRLDADVQRVLAQLDPVRQRLLIALSKTDLLSPASAELDREDDLDRKAARSLAEAEALIQRDLPSKFRHASIVPISCLAERLPQGVQPLLHQLGDVCRKLTVAGVDSAEEATLAETERSAGNILESTSDTATTDWNLGPPSLANLALGVSERQRALLEEARVHLGAFLDAVRVDDGLGIVGEGDPSGNIPTQTPREIDIVVAAEHLRDAANCLGRVSGKGLSSNVEEVLGVVFERFCVGK